MLPALELVINNYVQRKGIKTYSLTPQRWLAKDWGKPLQLGTAVAFFYGFRAMLNSHVEYIPNSTTDLSLNLHVHEFENYNIRITSSEGETVLSMTEINLDSLDRSYCIDNEFIALHSSEVSFKHELPTQYKFPADSGYFNYLLLSPTELC